jgi:hypothetical protein
MIPPFGTMPDPVIGCNGYAEFRRLGIWGNKMTNESDSDALPCCDSHIHKERKHQNTRQAKEKPYRIGEPGDDR